MDGTAAGTSTGVSLHHHIAANTDLQSFLCCLPLQLQERQAIAVTIGR
jgi:hypothetical protein